MLAVPRTQPAAGTSATGVLGITPDPVIAQAPSELSSAATAPRQSVSQRREARRRLATGRLPAEELKMGSNYSYRETNYDIGRSADRAGVKVKKFVPGDRFKAWRKTAVRRKRRAELNAIAKKKPSGKKARRG